jgi:hypoxanthine-guanine phosphoribosyltransferase
VIGYHLEAYGELAAGIERVLITQGQIEARVRELGEAISGDYRDKNPLLVGVLKGSCRSWPTCCEQLRFRWRLTSSTSLVSSQAARNAEQCAWKRI